MSKTILITGATDGIGLETARSLAQQGHQVILHGRSSAKLDPAKNTIASSAGVASDSVPTFKADFSDLNQVNELAETILKSNIKIDCLINNAGILKTANTITAEGFDVRFAVNTFAPFLLTQKLLPALKENARIVNVSSAAQAPVNLALLKGQTQTDEPMQAYAQSKLAITMCTRYFAKKFAEKFFENVGEKTGDKFGEQLTQKDLQIYAVNPGSLLASKMVKEGFGIAGNDLKIGSDILVKAALSEEFEGRSGEYYDNDNHQFAPPHPDALDNSKVEAVVAAIENVLAKYLY